MLFYRLVGAGTGADSGHWGKSCWGHLGRLAITVARVGHEESQAVPGLKL